MVSKEKRNERERAISISLICYIFVLHWIPTFIRIIVTLPLVIMYSSLVSSGKHRIDQTRTFNQQILTFQIRNN